MAIIARMDRISVAETKARLSELLDRAAAGEAIVVTRSGKPIARIAPLASREPRPFGVARHWPELPEDALLAPMDEEDLKAADGAYTDDFGVSRKKRGARAAARRRKPTAR
jgi:prevent-host-death family protein